MHYITLQQFCTFHRVEPVLIHEFIDYGIIELPVEEREVTVIPESQIPRIERALRLHNELEVNSAGIHIILRLLDQLESRGPVEDV